MFVSMTRAIKELHLFHARTRSGAIVHKNIYEKGHSPNMRLLRNTSQNVLKTGPDYAGQIA
jgi:superfamily I DNA/RNA helicase